MESAAALDARLDLLLRRGVLRSWPGSEGQTGGASWADEWSIVVAAAGAVTSAVRLFPIADDPKMEASISAHGLELEAHAAAFLSSTSGGEVRRRATGAAANDAADVATPSAANADDFSTPAAAVEWGALVEFLQGAC